MPHKETKTSIPPHGAGEVSAVASAPLASTLIEFPGTGRGARPQWRKELSERVREIQQRRALEAAREAEEAALLQEEQAELAEPAAPQLGLVPRVDGPELNPLVAAALRRIERARQQTSLPSATRVTSRGAAAATAVARVAEEKVQKDLEPLPSTSPKVQSAPTKAPTTPLSERIEKPVEPPRSPGLVVVPAPQVTKAEPVNEPAADKSKPRRVIAEVVDDAMLAHREAEREAAQAAAATAVAAPVEEIYDDSAPVAKRLVSGIADLLVVAFASSPFAAIIELTNGNWSDTRVVASMCSIVMVVMFLYMAASTALTGRTWGMALVSLRAIDADTGLSPTTGQSVRRTLGYMLSLAAFGIGIIYAFFDAEGRTAHDHLSGTVIVSE